MCTTNCSVEEEGLIIGGDEEAWLSNEKIGDVGKDDTASFDSREVNEEDDTFFTGFVSCIGVAEADGGSTVDLFIGSLSVDRDTKSSRLMVEE